MGGHDLLSQECSVVRASWQFFERISITGKEPSRCKQPSSFRLRWRTNPVGAALLTALTKDKVTYRALSVMDTGERGTVRFVPDDFAAAAKVLDRLNVRSDAADVLLAEVPNQVGAFGKSASGWLRII